ncbi:glycosyltransferase family 9 protein [Persephonella sp.]
MKKVLVVRLSSLGDVILASSVLDPLYSEGYRVDFLTFKPFGELFSGDRRVNRIIQTDRKELSGISRIKEFARNLESYDYIIDLHSNPRTFLLGLFSKGKVIRYRKNAIRRRLHIFPAGKKLLKQDLSFNVVNAYGEAIKRLGISHEKFRPSIIITEEEKSRVSQILPERFIAIGAGARYPNKAYPYFPQVSKLLTESGMDVVLVGSREDRSLDRDKYPKGVLDLRGELSLRESLAVISCAEACISNDSAVAHMARAVKTPVLMIYGATSPAFGFYPFPDEGSYIYKNLECQPCDLHGKKPCRFNTVDCLNIPPETVFQEALNLIKNSL